MVMRGQLDPLVEWMREQGVRRLRLPDGLEVELDLLTIRSRQADELEAHIAETLGVKPPAEVDDRPAPVAQALADEDGAGVCACGHSWLEHDLAGCLRGCSHEVCTSSATAEPEAAR